MNRRDALWSLGAGAAALATARLPSTAQGQSVTLPGLLTRSIPSSGEALPVIGLGTWQTFDVGALESERAPLAEVLREFVTLGGRVIDSSPMYGASESVVGELAAALGVTDRLFVATKVWTTGARAGVEQMETSMRRLRVARVDLMQVHNLVDVETHLATLREWKQAGRVRHIGVTHYLAGQHDAVARIVASQSLDFIQINFSVGERGAERRLLPLARDRGVAVIANRPFGGGDLFRRVRAKPLPDWAAALGCVTWAQLMLKFIVAHPAVTCAIPGTSQVGHLRDNMAAGRGEMPDVEMRERIAAAVA